MALSTCRSCGRLTSDAARPCVHCGTSAWAVSVPAEVPAPWPAQHAPAAAVAIERPAGTRAPAAAATFHPVAIHKLVVLSICTLGLYELYWFYRNWKLVRERTGQRLSPFGRAFFAPLWAYSLFEEVDREAASLRLQVGWGSGALAWAFFLLSATSRLPGPLWMISMASVAPLAAVQGTINELAARRGARIDDDFDVEHIAAIVVGGLFLLLAVVVSLVPQP